MPKFLEDKLKSEAAKRGFSEKQTARYVYGTMNNMGAMRGNRITTKGKRMEAKHAEDTSSVPHPHRNLGKFLHKPRGKKSRSSY